MNDFSSRSDNSSSSARSVWQDQFGRLAARSFQILGVLALLAVSVFILVNLQIVLVPVLIALILASAFAPIMRLFQKTRVPTALAALLVLVAIVGIFGLVIWLVSWAVISEWDNLAESAQEGVEQIQELITQLPLSINEEQLQDWQDSLKDVLSSGDFGSEALAGISTLANVGTGAALSLIVLFFFLKDGPQIWEFFLRPFTGAGYERGKRIGRVTVTTLGGYARGAAVVATVDAIGIGIGLLILQVPLVLPLTVIVFLTAFIPIIGAIIAGALAALVALVSQGPVAALVVVGISIAVNQLEGNLLQPLVMGRSVKLHALAILLVLTTGTVLGGVVGALLAVPVAAVAWRIALVWNGDESPAQPVAATPKNT